MDLKFSFGGASPDHHDHGGAPSVTPLPLVPLTASAGGGSTQGGALEASVRIDDGQAIGEVITGDGVTYARAEVSIGDAGALSRPVRSALARAVAALEGPLAGSISAVVFDLGADSPAVLAEFGINTDAPVVGAALQRQIGIPMGTVIRTRA